MSRRRRQKQYGFGSLLLDFILTILTGGLWLIWVVIRTANNTSNRSYR